MKAQLLELLPLEDGFWLTFWNVDKGRQLNLRVIGSGEGYLTGALYEIDRTRLEAPNAIRFIEPARARQVPQEKLAAPLVVPTDAESRSAPAGRIVGAGARGAAAQDYAFGI